MCHKSLSEYQSRHSNIKQEHDSSGGLLHDKAPSLPALGRRRHGRDWRKAWQGELCAILCWGDSVVLEACSIVSAGKTCWGDAILTSLNFLATLPVTPIETRFSPVFTALAYCTNRTKDQRFWPAEFFVCLFSSFFLKLL